jgi:hypothetical protein
MPMRSTSCRGMIRIRRFEEKCYELYTQEKIRGFLHLYDGEEAVAVGVAAALEDRDRVVSTYREHGHALARGMSMESALAEMYGKATGCAGGRGGSMHLFDAETNLYGGNAIVGGGLPLAVGLGLGDLMQGEDRVTVCFFGDGALAEGEFHESMNLAALWKLPVLFVLENNLYAMGSAVARVQANPDFTPRAAGYGMAGGIGRRQRRRRGRGRGAPLRRGDPEGRGAAVPRMPDLPHPAAFDVRRREVPRQGRGRGMAQAVANRPLPGLASRQRPCSPGRGRRHRDRGRGAAPQRGRRLRAGPVGAGRGPRTPCRGRDPPGAARTRAARRRRSTRPTANAAGRRSSRRS